MDDLIGATSSIGGIDSDDFLRSYDLATHRLAFHGETFEIVPVVQAINQLLPIAEAEAGKPHWDESQSATAAGGGQ